MVSCTPVQEVEPVIEYRDVIVEKEVIKYVNVTMPCNTTTVECPTENITVVQDNRSYVLSLIRQIKRCERHEGSFLNCSDQNDTFTRLRTNASNCQEELCIQNRSFC